MGEHQVGVKRLNTNLEGEGGQVPGCGKAGSGEISISAASEAPTSLCLRMPVLIFLPLRHPAVEEPKFHTGLITMA